MQTKAMKFSGKVLTILMAGVLGIGLSACMKEEGPAERAGKAVDNAVQEAGKKIEQAGEKVQDAAKDAQK
jgi:hypothetical protein